jgi:hypothetical protein
LYCIGCLFFNFVLEKIGRQDSDFWQESQE